jgi:hypothetical protein
MIALSRYTALIYITLVLIVVAWAVWRAYSGMPDPGMIPNGMALLGLMAAFAGFCSTGAVVLSWVLSSRKRKAPQVDYDATFS